MNLEMVLLKMDDLRDTIEAGEAAQRQLNECLSVVEEIMDTQTIYETHHSLCPGLTPIRDAQFRLTRDCELIRVFNNQFNRRVVQASTVEIPDANLVGCRVFPEVKSSNVLEGM